MPNKLRHVAETGSTNADMLARAAAGAAEGEWLYADRQSAGRGRMGRTWESPDGNLHASGLVRLRPHDPPAPTLALVAGVAVHEALGIWVEPHRLYLKWPNDVLADDAKIAGILLERAGDAVVVGVGVNLRQCPDDLDRPATSLAALGVAHPETDFFMETLERGFARWLGRWRADGLATIRKAWLDRAHPVGAALSAAVPDGSRIDGLFDGLDADCALRLRLADGSTRVIHAGDVFLIQDR